MHGAYKAFKQVLELAKFDYEKDELICLGDVCDGWPDVPYCFDELCKIENLIYIMGNHDWWAYNYFNGRDYARREWLSQGGQSTFDAYPKGMPQGHLDILKTAYPAMERQTAYGMQCFVHGGIDPNKNFENQDPESCWWDRDLLANARKSQGTKPHHKYGGYQDIFVGHTTTQCYSNELKPLHYCNVWDLDTGAGWSGKLTLMDVESKQYWQSDLVAELYPNVKGRI